MQIYAASYLLPINGSPVEGGAVAVENGRIMAIGRLVDLRREFTTEVNEFPGSVIIPGLVNAHTHLELTHFPAWHEKSRINSIPHSYVDWIKQVIRVKRGVDLNALSESLLDGLNSSLQCGTTMVGDILSDRRLVSCYRNASISGRVYFEFLGQDPAKYRPLLNSLRHDINSLPENFLPGISPHAPFTVSKPLLNSLLETAQSAVIPITMHLAESAEENMFFQDATGRIANDLYPFVGWDDYLPLPLGITSTEWLNYSGALSPDFTAVHGVHLNQSDINMIKKNGSSVVLVPRSNSNLAVGRAPVEMMVKAGLPLSLGTDSLASSDSLSLWDEMRFLLDAYPETFAPFDALTMATIGGAKAIKRDHETGSLAAGKRADFVVMEIGGTPVSGRIYEQLLEDSRVHCVWCKGEKVWTTEA